MDKKEAAAIAEAELGRLRTTGYTPLVERVDSSETHEVTPESGTVYQVQTMVYWDGKGSKDLRVIVAVDDGGWSAYHPLTRDMILSPPDPPSP